MSGEVNLLFLVLGVSMTMAMLMVVMNMRLAFHDKFVHRPSSSIGINPEHEPVVFLLLGTSTMLLFPKPGPSPA